MLKTNEGWAVKYLPTLRHWDKEILTETLRLQDKEVKMLTGTLKPARTELVFWAQW